MKAGWQSLGGVKDEELPANMRGMSASQRQQALKFAECMRANGEPDFPDPTFGNDTVTFNIPPNLDRNSPEAKSAVAICIKLIPPGLPYSNSAPGLPADNSSTDPQPR